MNAEAAAAKRASKKIETRFVKAKFFSVNLKKINVSGKLTLQLQAPPQ
jgi:hypothetical protein